MFHEYTNKAAVIFLYSWMADLHIRAVFLFYPAAFDSPCTIRCGCGRFCVNASAAQAKPLTGCDPRPQVFAG